ncbi:MAG TPA: tetratricopeptide repeat protein [candidate division Zixibacteria bacterium]|nr:tetratricopeptide repeat protein [candidate division Zixibacteria bacterium]
MNEEQVISTFTPIVAKNPGDPRFARLGDAYLTKGDLRKALEILTAGVGANPTYTTGQQILARALAKAGYLKEARDRFEIVLRIDPSNVAAIWEIARIDLKQGKTEEGIERLRALLSLDPFDEKAKRELKNLNVDVAESVPPPPLPQVAPLPEEEKTATPAPPSTGAMEFEKLKGGAAPSTDEISSIEKELEELLKMDISDEEAAGLDIEEMASGEDFAPLDVAPEPDVMPSETFEPPAEEPSEKLAEQSFEEAFSSIGEDLPAFDLEQIGASEEVAEEQPYEKSPAKAEDTPAVEELPSFEMEKPAKSEATASAATTDETDFAEDMPSFEMEAPPEEDFDFTPPSQKQSMEAPAPSPEVVEEPDLDETFDFTPPSESKDTEGDFFDFAPPEKPKATLEKPPSMADALKELEIEDEPAPAPQPEVESVPTPEATPAPEPELDVPPLTIEIPDDEPITDEGIDLAEDIPTLETGATDQTEENLTGIGGYQFTDTIAEKPVDPDSDEDGIEVRHDFEPADEEFELEGFIGTAEFKPPEESPSGPEFVDLDFADELDGIAPNPEPEEEQTVEAEKAIEETLDEELPDEPDLLTVTMAEIYAGQGDFKKAISIYKSILKRTEEESEIDRIEKRIEHLTKILSSGIDGNTS